MISSDDDNCSEQAISLDGHSEDSDAPSEANNKVTYSVVYAKKDTEYCVLPNTWIYYENGKPFGKWPKSKVTTKDVIKAAVLDEYDCFEINIIQHFDNYKEAAHLERQLLNATGSESESNRKFGRGCRKKKKCTRYSEFEEKQSDDSHSDNYEPVMLREISPRKGLKIQEGSEFQVKTNSHISTVIAQVHTSSLENPHTCGAELSQVTEKNNDDKSKRNSSLSCLEMSNLSSQRLDDANEPNKIIKDIGSRKYLKTQKGFKSQVKTNSQIVKEITVNASTMGSSCVDEVEPFHRPIENDKDNETNGNNNFLSALEITDLSTHTLVPNADLRKIKLYLKRIDTKLTKVLNQEENGGKEDFRDELKNILQRFPLNNWDELKRVEEEFESNDTSDGLSSFYKSIGGVDPKNFVKRVLSRTFTNSLASTCSYYGKKNNHPLKDLQLIKILRDTVLDIFKITEATFEDIVKEWFRHAKQRLTRELSGTAA